jgi:tRNA modification GTPase
LDQYGGSLRRALEAIDADLRSLRLPSALGRLGQLRQWARFGLHLTRPWQVVLAGPTNVGKSRLINAMVGYRRAIVYDGPGTTRDTLTATTALDGWPVQLADTAGLRETTDAVEMAGVAQTKRGLADADLVVLVFDVHARGKEDHRRLKAQYPDALIVYNKCDGAGRTNAPGPPGLEISALTGSGVPELLDRILRLLVPQSPLPGTAIPFTQAQVDILSACQDGAVQGNAAAAAHCLQPLLAPTLGQFDELI